ncbi:MAG: transcription elongation factor GreAB [Comamonadaceae bacterium]|nr:MAG: transcription elongation factor GreAB [Comamonadaceae bacterium]
MHVVVHAERKLTDLDFARLTKLADEQLPLAFSEMLDVVEVVPRHDIPTDLVTMNSRIEIVDVHTSRRHELTICYPRDADPSVGLISVLSPVGSSLIGLKVCDVARWLAPNGEDCAAQIVAIQYRPEDHSDDNR